RVLGIGHRVDTAKQGPAGGDANLGHGTFVVAALGGVAAAIVGSSAGAGDLDAGVYRELVVTGRSRLSLLLARIPAGLAYLLPFGAPAYALACVAGTVVAGSLPAPGGRLVGVGGVWGVPVGGLV